jgi:hypothetical protein
MRQPLADRPQVASWTALNLQILPTLVFTSSSPPQECVLAMLANVSSSAPPNVSPLAREVSQQLIDSGRLRLRQIRVQEHDRGTVVLSGHVPSFYLKQLAQSIAGSVNGVASVRNETVVARAV